MENQEQQPMKVMAVELCKAMGRMHYSPHEFKHKMNSTWREPTMLAIADFALEQLDAARKADVELHEKNAPAIEMNMRIHNRVASLMVEIAMPEGWSERDPSSRARVPKTIRHSAGWRTDLAKHCLINDNFAAATAQYENLLAKYQAYRVDAVRDSEQKACAAEREKEAVIAARRADMELAAILLRYELPIDSDWSDVLDALRAKDQRLDLAVAMEQVRGDWNEGCGAVESALSRFTIRDNEDKDIANDVLGCTRDFEDGRVFRDTTWSYGALYASVTNRQLVADAQTAYSHTNNN